MPTGYTADIKDGISFRTFALNCARAFGACLPLRDLPSGGHAIPDKFLPSEYDKNQLQKAQDELAKLKQMTSEQWGVAAQAEYDLATLRHAERVTQNQQQLKSYKEMLNQVMAWNPPAAHKELHEFMKNQIQESIKFDCWTDEEIPAPTLKPSEKWFNDELSRVLKSIECHEKAYRDELDRTAGRNKWIKDLRDSLPLEH